MTVGILFIMRLLPIALFPILATATVANCREPSIVHCEAGRWDGYAILAPDESSPTEPAQDFISYPERFYSFTEGSSDVMIVEGERVIIGKVVDRAGDARTVFWTHIEEPRFDLVQDDGTVIATYLRYRILRSSSQTFIKKCSPRPKP